MDIYTDGSCLGNPGVGGWALYCPSTGVEKVGTHPHTTNNQMEMRAILEALQIEGVTKIVTDSNYCKQGVTTWSKKWERNGWRTATGGAVKNVDLWKQIIALKGRVEFEWVKAHSVNPHNQKVDKLAHDAAEALKNK